MTSQVIKIKLKDIKLAIANLAKHAQYPLRDLHRNAKLNRDHRLISYTVSELYHQQQYSLIIDVIESHDRPSILIPGTVGAYLFGCLLPTYGDGERDCSPLCIGSVPYPPSAKGTKFCDDSCNNQVWVVQRYSSRVEYVKVNASTSKSAIIYVDTEFGGFSSYEVQTFANHGVRRAKVMDTTEDGHHTLYNECKLSDLPMSEGQSSVSAGNDDDDNRTAVVVLVSVIVILIIFVILWTLLYY